MSDKLIDLQKLLTTLHALLIEEYEAVRGICARVPTRFGNGPLVLRDVMNSKAALHRLVCLRSGRMQWLVAQACRMHMI
jgi:hypothetical protein